MQLLQPVYLKTLNYNNKTSRALQKKWIGPYYIVKIVSPHSVLIAPSITGEPLKTQFHVDLLKPAYIRHIKNEDTQAIEIENLDPADIPRLQIHFKDMPRGDNNTAHTKGSLQVTPVNSINRR